MNLKRLTMVKDSDYTAPIGAPDEDWLESEVEHWFYDTDILAGLKNNDEWDVGNTYDIANIIGNAILSHNDIESHGFSTSPYSDYNNDFYSDVKYFVQKIMYGE